MDANIRGITAPADAGKPAAAAFRPTEDNVRRIGRCLDDGSRLWLIHSGSAVSFTVSARSAHITVRGGHGSENSADKRPRYAVYIDGKLTADRIADEEDENIVLFSGEELRTAEVRLIHLSEAMHGAVGVGDITLDTDSAAPIAPTGKRRLRIEFIGDSITCAYGVEADSYSEPFTTATQNFTKSYAYLACEQIGAEYSAVSFSGHGIISGYTDSGERVPSMLVPPYYRNCGCFPEFSQPWDFSSHPCDAVVINLGTNDASFIDHDFGARSPEFVTEYARFLREVRSCNPDAQIICTLGIMGCGAEYPLIEQAVAEYSAETGDTRISCSRFTEQDEADGYGADWHPSEITQRKAGKAMADILSRVLGIPHVTG